MEILNALQRADHNVLARVFRQGERRMVIPLAKAVSRSGDGYLHALIPLLLLITGTAQAWNFTALLAASLVVERSLYFSLKNSLRRRRPQDLMPGFRSLVTASDKFSFPSGHSSGAFLLATVLIVIYGGPVFAMYLWACGVALSRIILGVHFPGDTLAGACMGVSSVLFVASYTGLG